MFIDDMHQATHGQEANKPVTGKGLAIEHVWKSYLSISPIYHETFHNKGHHIGTDFGKRDTISVNHFILIYIQIYKVTVSDILSIIYPIV